VNRLSTIEPGAQLPVGSTPLPPPRPALLLLALAGVARAEAFLPAGPRPAVTAGKGRVAAEPTEADPAAPGDGVP
jgi:hypothetical protein